MGLVKSKHQLKKKKTSSVMRNMSLMATVFYIVATSAIVLFSSSSSALSEQEEQAMIYLLKQDCGSCHGLTLQGGLGPALLKKNLKGKPLDYIESVISYGRPGTPMPPWKDLLNEQQINFIARYLLSDKNTLISESEQNQDSQNKYPSTQEFAVSQKITSENSTSKPSVD